MTAKRRGGRGMVARLEALEAKEAARREEVRGQNWELLQRARAMLSPADRLALDDARILGKEDGEEEDGGRALLLRRMEEACKAHNLPEEVPVSHPAKADADAWEAIPEDSDGTRPLVPPPAGRVGDFCAYFEACALWCEEEARREDWPEDLRRLARWGAAVWRFEANLCALLGGQA